MKSTDELIEIKDATAKTWYDFGFRFAINYVYAIMPESSRDSFDKKAFKALLDKALNSGIEEDFFEKKHPFFDDDGYENGQCPGEKPGQCISCPDNAITPLRRENP